MAITIENAPDKISFAKNPIKFRLETDNYILQEGVKSRVGFTLESVLGASDITFTFLGYELTFEGVTTPDSSGMQYQINNVWSNLSNYIDYLVGFFNKNYLLSTHCRIYRDGGTINFEAREKGLANAIGMSNNGFNGSSVAVPAEDEEVRPNFKFLVEVWVKNNDGEFEKAITEEYDPIVEVVNDETLVYADVYVQEVLKAYVKGDVPVENKMLSETDTYNEIIVEYYLRYAEKYGDPQAVALINSTEEFYCLRGGLRNLDFERRLFEFSEIVTMAKGKALLPHKNTIYTNKNKPEYLYFIYYIIGLQTPKLSIKIEGIFEDGPETILASLNLEVELGINVIKIDVSKIYLYDFDSDIEHIFTTYYDYIKYIEFYIIEGSSYRSDIVRYVPKPEKLTNTYFIYENSVGGWESFWCTGEREENMPTEKTEFTTTKNDIAISSSESNGYKISHKINTGPFGKDDIVRFMDLVNSDEVYYCQISEDGRFAFKVNINKSNYSYLKTSDDIFNGSFNYTFAEEEKGISKLLSYV
jgi:hypothetical protein